MLYILHNIVLQYHHIFAFAPLQFEPLVLHFGLGLLDLLVRHQIFLINPSQVQRQTCVALLHVLLGGDEVTQIFRFADAEYLEVVVAGFDVGKFDLVDELVTPVDTSKWEESNDLLITG